MFILLSVKSIYAQEDTLKGKSMPSFGIGIGYNYYTNHYLDYERTDGITLKFLLEKDINNSLYISTNLNTSFSREFYYYLRPESFLSSNLIVDRSKSYSLGLQLPFYLTYNIYKSKFFLLSGICFSIDNFLVITSMSGEDPEVGSSGSHRTLQKVWPQRSKIGFGHQFGFMYKPSAKVGITGEIKTLKNNEFGFTYFELGINYAFNKSISI